MVRDLNYEAQEFFVRLPKNEWIPFNTIPHAIFHLVFAIIDRSSNIAVDKNYTEFIIMSKIQFPNRLARE